MARVEYRELICKSVINRVHGMPFKWSINPYRGCAHGCHYCYARGTHTYLDLGAGDDFSSIIFAKVNAPSVLYQELRRPSWRRESISIGSATDPYQPAEGRFRITRRLLEILHDFRNPVGIVTKGSLIVRDCDLLANLERRAGCTVCFSIPTVDPAIWRASEPGTSPPAQRLRAMERLAVAGVHVGVLAAPILPGITSDVEQLEAVAKAAAAHGARFLWANMLHLGALERDHYMRFLHSEYPDLVPLHARLYRGKYPPPEVALRLEARVAVLKTQYGLDERERPDRMPHQTEITFSPAAASHHTI